MQNQGMPKIVSSQCLENTTNYALQERMKHCNENRASRKMYHYSLSKPPLNSNFKIGQGSSEEKWKYLRGETLTENIYPPKPRHPLLNDNYFVSENTKQTWAQKWTTNENVSWMSKRGGVLMQGRSDIKTASGLNDHRSAEMALKSSDGERGRKRAPSIDVVMDVL